jgi:DUF438 domain-containing protein
MSELINNSSKRKELLKHIILQLHQGQAPEAVRTQLVRLLGQVPYGEVVEVEQQLIAEGLPQEEVLKLCDVHTEALRGVIDVSSSAEPAPGHPAHTFSQENQALKSVISKLEKLLSEVAGAPDEPVPSEKIDEIKKHFNELSDVEKHYRRKENLLFPFLEKKGITGPPSVMWGKHDETRELLAASHQALSELKEVTAEELNSVIDFVLKPSVAAVDEMIYKEENILFPMCLDNLSDSEWYDIYRQSDEIGYCLYDPQTKWEPAGLVSRVETKPIEDKIQLPTGSFTREALNVLLNTLPVDITFVDKDDTVRYFSFGKERIFDRTRAILGRKVQLCHPPSSVHIVQQILDDFHSGKQDSAAFWINLHSRFIHIEYFALRAENGEYLGTLEVSQDLTEKRALQGEQRILQYHGAEEK